MDHVVVLGALVGRGLLVLAAAELALGDGLLLVLLQAEVLLVCCGLVGGGHVGLVVNALVAGAAEGPAHVHVLVQGLAVQAPVSSGAAAKGALATALHPSGCVAVLGER